MKLLPTDGLHGDTCHLCHGTIDTLTMGIAFGLRCDSGVYVGGDICGPSCSDEMRVYCCVCARFMTQQRQRESRKRLRAQQPTALTTVKCSAPATTPQKRRRQLAHLSCNTKRAVTPATPLVPPTAAHYCQVAPAPEKKKEKKKKRAATPATPLMPPTSAHSCHVTPAPEIKKKKQTKKKGQEKKPRKKAARTKEEKRAKAEAEAAALRDLPTHADFKQLRKYSWEQKAEVLMRDQRCRSDLTAACNCSKHGGPRCGVRLSAFFRELYPEPLGRAEDELTHVLRCLRSQRFTEKRLGTEDHWLFEELLRFREEVPKEMRSSDAKDVPYELRYKLEGVSICREAWHILAGWPMAGKAREQAPRRALRFEAAIIRGVTEVELVPTEKDKENPTKKQVSSAAGNNTALCRRWCHKYMGDVSCTVPAVGGSGDGDATHGKMYYTQSRPGFEWMQYVDDIAEEDRVCRSLFNKCMRKLLDTHWEHEATGQRYKLEKRTPRARGFKQCEICEKRREELRVAVRERAPQKERQRIRDKWGEHLRQIRRCRNTYADHKLEAMHNEEVASAAMDAAAQAGHRLPITASDCPRLIGMEKLQLKITGVLVHGAASTKKGYYAFVTPPWIKTGANLSCTVLMELIAAGVLKGQKRWYLQVDGASDNIAYTVMYFSAWLLLMSQMRCFGDLLVLEKIILSRLPVGHTHIDIDQVFSVLARWLFGMRKSMTKPKDVHTVDAFLRHIREAHKNIKKCGMIGACFDFDELFRGIKHSATDTGIQDYRVFEFSTRSAQPGVVFLQTKEEMDSKEWVPWRAGTDTEYRFWPNGSKQQMPGPSKPTKAALTDWKKREEFASSLEWFLEGQDSVNVTGAVRRAWREFMRDVPDDIRDVQCDGAWPVIVADKDRAVILEAEEEEARRIPAPGAGKKKQRQVLPAGLTQPERRTKNHEATANEQFKELRGFKKGALVVLMSNGQLELGEAVADVDLGACDEFTVQYWVNAQTGNVGEEEGRRLAEAPPNFNMPFVVYPREWRPVFKVAETTVFWAGDADATLKKASSKNSGRSFLLRVQKHLSRIDSFPLKMNDGRRQGEQAPEGAQKPQEKTQKKKRLRKYLQTFKNS